MNQYIHLMLQFMTLLYLFHLEYNERRTIKKEKHHSAIFLILVPFSILDRTGRTMLGFHRQWRIIRRRHRVFIVPGSEKSRKYRSHGTDGAENYEILFDAGQH